MRIGLLSYHPTTSLTDPEIYSDFQSVCEYAEALQRHGAHIHWLSSADTAEALAADPRLVAADAHDVPATCRYVVPYQGYRVGGVPLLCVDSAVWQQSDLHTRLFTFCCLLQRQRPCEVFHAWGTLQALYLAVYTAGFLDIPAVVSYGPSCRDESVQRSWLWQWVAQHTALAVVASTAERERLLATGDFLPSRVHVVESTLPTLVSNMTALYRHLRTA